MDIQVSVGNVVLDAELNDTLTARRVAAVLPLDLPFKTWGDEIYFEIPVGADLDESAQEEVAVGDLGYWPTGRAFCIFFGPTPMSRDGKIIPASAVNMIGRVTGDVTRLKGVRGTGRILVEAKG
ncbi:MAG: cyclophilin-like fold protein [Candidatus Desulfacyla sp.]